MKEESEIDIIKKLKKEFLKEDKKEPFLDREYVDESLRIFDILSEGIGDFEDETDRAIYDIVQDIFRYFRIKNG
jgi:hypothetical protein